MEAISLLKGLGIVARTILHIGANHGAEFDAYVAADVSFAMYVEPIPEVFEMLQTRLRGNAKHVAVKALCLEQGGQEVSLNIASNRGESSSILQFADHAKFFPDIVYKNVLKLRSIRADDLIELLPDGIEIDLIVIDTQGTELRVLRGAEALLRQARAVYVEVYEKQIYVGADLWQDTNDFLAAKSFLLKYMSINPYNYGNALFVKSEAAMQRSADASLVNVALNKPARQSSVSRFSRPDDAQGACNGRKTGGYGFHTELENNPWWEVDLLADIPVDQVVVYNRLDAARERAFSFVLKVGTSREHLFVLHRQEGRAFGGIDGRAACIALGGLRVRFVRIELNAREQFHLDEVEVYADASRITGEEARKAGATSGAPAPVDTIYACRSDGLGTRMLTIMYAKLAAMTSGRRLKVIWPDLVHGSFYAPGALRAEDVGELFARDQIFRGNDDTVGKLENFSDAQLSGLPSVSRLSQEQLGGPFSTAASMVYDIPFPIRQMIKSMEKKDVVETWNQIDWSPFITAVIVEAMQEIDFSSAIGVHVRRGDIIQQIINPEVELFRKTAAQVFQRYAPLTSYFAALDRIQTNEKIVVFSEDSGVYEEFRARFGDDRVVCVKCRRGTFNQLAAIDLILLSKVKTMVSPSVSFFSRCAQAVCSGEFINLEPSVEEIFGELIMLAKHSTNAEDVKPILYEEALERVKDSTEGRARVTEIYKNLI